MTATLTVTAFGHMSPKSRRSLWGVEEDLYKVFLARSELMGWSRISSSEGPHLPLLWGMNDAELTEGDGAEVGWVQVGLDVHGRTELLIPDRPPPGIDLSRGAFAAVPETGAPIDPVVALPPLIRCVDDSLRWFGELGVSAYEVIVSDIAPRVRPHLGALSSGLAWFHSDLSDPVRGLVTLATGRSTDHILREIADDLRQRPGRLLAFGPLINLRDGYPTEEGHWPVVWAGTDTGLEVAMPEWSADAIGWVAARVVEAALSLESAPQALSVRVTRSPSQEELPQSD